MKSMVNTQILPACLLYHGALSQAAANAKAAGLEAPQTAALKQLTDLITRGQTKFADLQRASKTAEDTHDEYKKAELYATSVSTAMVELRTVIDEIEAVMIDDAWPLAKYREMLFIS
jgi:glutamine synthetase